MAANGANGMVLEASASASYKPRATTRRSGRFGDDTAIGSVNSRCRAVPQAQPLSSNPDDLESKRGDLLAEKQALLENVLDKHDDLVRELFHMQQFTMMILYDPVEAKGDNSEVFQEFKAGFDLLANATPTPHSTRQTRRSTNERRQMLGSTSASAASRSSLSPAKRKAKTKSLNAEELWNVIASSKGHKKQGKSRVEDVSQDDYNPKKTSASRSFASSDEIVVRHRKPVRKEVTANDDDIGYVPLQPSFKEEPPGESISKGMRKRKRLRDDSPAPTLLSPSSDRAQNIIVDSNGMKENLYLAARDDSVSTELTRRGSLKELPLRASVIKSKFRPAGVSPVAPPPSFEPAPAPLLSPSRSNVKRIKLIVRRPPPAFSNPHQRPPRPKFNTSLNAFLTSYITVDADVENADRVELEQGAAEEAKLREKVAKLRRKGLVPQQVSQQETDDSEMEVDEDADYAPPQRTSKDIWDIVVQDVIARHQAKPRRSAAKVVTSSIASKVQTHFDTLEGKRLKAKEAEERRLRNLAKMTMKMVIGEWRKAVFHIREKQRLEDEEEERRLGHAHLDAILNQSGQILETQQGDLSKANSHLRSRSGSLLDVDDDDNTDSDSDREGTAAGDNISLDGDIGSDPDEPVEKRSDGEDTYMLLGENFGTEITTRSGTPSTNVQDGDDGADGLSTADLLDGAVVSNEVGGGLSVMDLEDLVYPAPDSSPMRPSSGVLTLEVETKDADVTAVNDAPLLDSPHPRTGTPSQNDTLQDQSVHLPLDSDELHDKQDDDKGLNLAEVQRLGQHEGENDSPIVQEDITHPIQDEIAEPAPESMMDPDVQIPEHLKSFAVAAVNRDPDEKVTPPLLLRGVLRPYQQSGLEWLASLHTNKLNGILADEMGLGKTIQTIALLAHLACDLGIWGPHLIVVPTSVLLNWEMEFKKFLPGFRTLSYHGNTKRRKELRQGWNDKHHFNVCITSYALASRDAHIFKRKAWYYMILDEAHMIKNFKSQRWNILLMFRSYRRLLLTGTPLQNNLTELWALLQFLMSGANFANLKEFGEWFANPLEKAIEMGNVHDDDTIQRVSKLHTVLRPYLLRRLKRDVEKELPSKYEHLTLCPLSKRQRFLYDEFMSRAPTRDALQSGVYQRIANILMQLRKVCNHPDLFEVRPIVTSFAMSRSAIADFEIKDMLIRRRLLNEEKELVDLDVLGLRFVHHQNTSLLATVATKKLDATALLPYFAETVGDAPIKDTRTIEGFRNFVAYSRRAEAIARWTHKGYLNRLRCNRIPIYSEECLNVVNRLSIRIIPFSHLDTHLNYMDNVDGVNMMVKSYSTRAKESANIINAFAFATPPVVAPELPHLLLAGFSETIQQLPLDFDEPLHTASVKLQIAFPEASLLQYDCGKLQKLASLLREKKTGGHRVLIFTQMTRILDILELFLNVHGYLYLRLDGATKIEDRQYITERFNADSRVFCFISSSRSGGVGINLTGADTVIFYDSDFNPQMDRQCEDRAHRIGQIRDVHIYRFVSQYTVEEAMLRKANQKRSLDDLVIQKGEFDWRTLFNDESTSALTRALDEYEDAEDRLAAVAAAREETSLVGADEDDFDEVDIAGGGSGDRGTENVGQDDNEVEDEQGATVLDYMLIFIERDWDHFSEWKA